MWRREHDLCYFASLSPVFSSTREANARSRSSSGSLGKGAGEGAASETGSVSKGETGSDGCADSADGTLSAAGASAGVKELSMGTSAGGGKSGLTDEDGSAASAVAGVMRLMISSTTEAGTGASFWVEDARGEAGESGSAAGSVGMAGFGGVAEYTGTAPGTGIGFTGGFFDLDTGAAVTAGITGSGMSMPANGETDFTKGLPCMLVIRWRGQTSKHLPQEVHFS